MSENLIKVELVYNGHTRDWTEIPVIDKKTYYLSVRTNRVYST